MKIEQLVVREYRVASTSLHSLGHWGWKSISAVVATAALLVACGNNANSGNDDSSGAAASSAAEPVAAPIAPNPAASGTAVVAAPGIGQAVVEVGGHRYEFVVIQCLRDVKSPLSGAVIGFQLDGIPSATPPDVTKRLLGVIDADADVLGEIRSVVKFGPILSITQVTGGGELLSITDLDAIEIKSDGDPTSPASRSLKVSSGASGATVTGTSATSAGMATVSATCP